MLPSVVHRRLELRNGALVAVVAPESVKHSKSKLARYQALWAELHTMEDPTPEWFESWLCRVRRLRCDCVDKLERLILDNPPDFADWPRYSWRLHNAVNVSLGKPILEWDQAKSLWGWKTD